MKVININSGLGNQMFQYAFILNYKLKGEKIKLDTILEDKLRYHNGFELKNIFSIEDELILEIERIRLLGPVFLFKGSEFHFLRIFRKILKSLRLERIFHFDRYIHENEMNSEDNFNRKYLEIKSDAYFYGFFQSYKYFENIKEEVFRVFSFPEIPETDTQNFEILKKIRNSESISLHIRRGDYLSNPFFNVCDIKYYRRSLEFVFKENLERGIKKESINLFIFSDDIEWCKNNLNFLKSSDVSYINWNKKENSYKDMQLMSECKHNIISNSTFSWWGGYLNKNKNKIVCAPEYWFTDIKTTEDRCEKDWVLL